jgi:hypothetical protein
MSEKKVHPKLLPVGVQSFPQMIEENYVYVDKTEVIYKLVKSGSRAFFLSRPRRFGKSLTVSTLAEYFKGNEELFRGLALHKLEPPKSEGGWKEHIVFRFDLSTENYRESQGAIRKLRLNLMRPIKKIESELGVSPDLEESVSGRFINAIDQASKISGNQVVILVDEYDQPLGQNLDNLSLFDSLRDELRSFFTVLKSASDKIAFSFLTGVTRFPGLTLFSGLNQVNNVTFDEKYADICGVTESELEQVFSANIDEMAVELGADRAEMIGKLRYQYDGYDFTGAGLKIYNPYSLVLSFDHLRISDFWFETGTNRLLITELAKFGDIFRAVSTNYDVTSDIDSLSQYTYDKDERNMITLLFQSGYLSIKSKLTDVDFALGYPNREVQNGMIKYLVDYIVNRNESLTNEANEIARSFRLGKSEEFMKGVNFVFSKLTHKESNKSEQDFKTIMKSILISSNVDPQTEVAGPIGTADLIAKTQHYIYIFEFKLKGKNSADTVLKQAFDQIETQGYARPFTEDPNETRTIVKVVIVFDEIKRKPVKWEFRGLPPTED